MSDKPKVGIGVCIIKEDKILFGQRKNTHGEGNRCRPGGHLEFGESREECAHRETSEEAGIEITNIRFLTVTNDIFHQENKHYVTILMVAEHLSGDPQVLEPEKMVKWQRFSRDDPPRPLFLPIQQLIDQDIHPI